jgi:hypothetical protein
MIQAEAFLKNHWIFLFHIDAIWVNRVRIAVQRNLYIFQDFYNTQDSIRKQQNRLNVVDLIINKSVPFLFSWRNILDTGRDYYHCSVKYFVYKLLDEIIGCRDCGFYKLVDAISLHAMCITKF